MTYNVLLVDDDKHVIEELMEFFELEDHGELIKFKWFRHLNKAAEWIGDKQNAHGIKCCILDLMFPPSHGEYISGDIADLAKGIKFYENYLKNRIKTIVLTGALAEKDVRESVHNRIPEDSNTIIIEKPPKWELVRQTICRWVLGK